MTDKRSLHDERRSSRPQPDPGQKPDLGQKEAALEKASDEQLSHMEGGKAAKAAREKKKTIARDK